MADRPSPAPLAASPQEAEANGTWYPGTAPAGATTAPPARSETKLVIESVPDRPARVVAASAQEADANGSWFPGRVPADAGAPHPSPAPAAEVREATERPAIDDRRAPAPTRPGAVSPSRTPSSDRPRRSRASTRSSST